MKGLTPLSAARGHLTLAQGGCCKQLVTASHPAFAFPAFYRDEKNLEASCHPVSKEWRKEKVLAAEISRKLCPGSWTCNSPSTKGENFPISRKLCAP